MRTLLHTFNLIKTPMSKEKTFKEVAQENFHLMRPYNPTTYLKFLANEKILKLGSAYTP